MENVDSRLEALQDMLSDSIAHLVASANRSFDRIRRDMQEVFDRLSWVENECKALRRLWEANHAV